MKYVTEGVRRLGVVSIAVLSLLVSPLGFIHATNAEADRASEDKAAFAPPSPTRSRASI